MYPKAYFNRTSYCPGALHIIYSLLSCWYDRCRSNERPHSISSIGVISFLIGFGVFLEAARFQRRNLSFGRRKGTAAASTTQSAYWTWDGQGKVEK